MEMMRGWTSEVGLGWMEGEVLRFGEDGGRGGCWDGVGCDGIGWDLWGWEGLGSDGVGEWGDGVGGELAMGATIGSD